MSEERDRIWRLLVQEIQMQQASIKLWEETEVGERVKQTQIYGFECQLMALITFGTKVFGHTHEYIEKYTKEEKSNG